MTNMYSSQRSANHLPPIWKNKADPVLHLRLYRNGDQFYPGKPVAVNQKQFRTFESWLSDLSNSMRLKNGAVRRVYTPTNGTRCDDFENLQEGQSLVLAGQEKFKPLRYDQIISTSHRKSEPFKYDADPVVHSRLFQCSGKIRKIENQSIIIKVWPNGGEKKVRRPRVVLLRRGPSFNMATVIPMVNEMLKDDCNGPVEALYSRQGSKLADVEGLESNGVYVALTRRDRFKRALYSDFATRDLHVSPRPDRKGLDPLFSRSNNSTSHSSPEHSNASSSQSNTNGHINPKRRPIKREEDQVFPAKPVKHQRSEKSKKVDLDKDEGGLFKAKGSNSNTRGAREVNDTRHTKVDLPVDQQKARVVHEEIPNGHKEERSRPPPQPTTNNHHPRGGYPEAKTNSRRAPPPAASVKNNKRKEKNDNNDEFIRDIKRRREQSAVKIQAGFRGYQTRKNIALKKASGQSPARMNTMSPRPRSSSPPPPSNRQSSRRSPQQSTAKGRQRSPSPPPAYDFAEEQQAAIRIQAGYRGYASRKQTELQKAEERERDELEKYQSLARNEAQKVTDMATDRFEEEEHAATRIQAGIRGYQARKEYKAKRAITESQSKNDEEELAATKIQAGFRGFKARSSLRENNQKKEEQPAAKPAPRPAFEDDEDDEDDYDKAATKIQAGFRGYQVRKGLRI